jgi:hypothetical protein
VQGKVRPGLRLFGKVNDADKGRSTQVCALPRIIGDSPVIGLEWSLSKSSPVNLGVILGSLGDFRGINSSSLSAKSYRMWVRGA